MRYSLPVILILALMNIYHVLKPVESDGGQSVVITREYRFSMLKDVALLQAQDELFLLRTTLNDSREIAQSQRKEAKSRIAGLEAELGALVEENRVLKNMVNSYQEAATLRLRLTAYTARPEECNADVDNTAIMQTPVPGWTVAVSRDLKGWLGKRVYIEGFGIRQVNDLMHARHSRAIDVLVADVPAARRIGVRNNVQVALVEPLAMDGTDLDRDLVALFTNGPVRMD